MHNMHIKLLKRVELHLFDLSQVPADDMLFERIIQKDCKLNRLPCCGS